MKTHTGKFLPHPSPTSRVYWEGCRKHQLLIQHCSACGHYQFYPRSFCTCCMAREPAWEQASGLGTVASWTVVRRPVSEAYAAQTPYVIALIELDEGPVMMSQVTGCDVDGVRSGMRVEVAFEAWSEQVTMPVFRLAQPAAPAAAPAAV
jgi:uncharacterized OB-fold protein